MNLGCATKDPVHHGVFRVDETRSTLILLTVTPEGLCKCDTRVLYTLTGTECVLHVCRSCALWVLHTITCTYRIWSPLLLLHVVNASWLAFFLTGWLSSPSSSLSENNRKICITIHPPKKTFLEESWVGKF